MRFIGMVCVGLGIGFVSKHFGNPFEVTFAFMIMFMGVCLLFESILTSAIKAALKDAKFISTIEGDE